MTAGALTALWNFSGDDDFSVPPPEAIEAAQATVGYMQLTVDNLTVQLNGNARLDLGGIAKGYIADEMKKTLLTQGVTSAVINLGGNVVTVGTHPDGKPFRIGVRKPFTETGEVIGVLSVGNLSVVTSGVDQRGAEADGVYYHHLIDLADGYPADTGLLSVTVISPQSADGDALSTVCYLLGTDGGAALIENIPETEAIFITTGGEIITTSGIGSDIPFALGNAE